ncbi:MAG: phosphate ABC transporter substrate-binding protein [Desulfobulbaceae bacterium]
MRTRGIIATIVFLALALAINSAQGAEKITTAGSSTVRPIVDDGAKAFKKTHPDVQFVVGGGGSSHGVKAVGTGEVDIGQASRYIYEKEMKQFPNLVPFMVGLDGIAVIVNAANPVNAVTKKQVQDIYSGKITNWKEVGGKDAPIQLITKDEGRSTLDLFLKYFGLEVKEVGEGRNMRMLHKAKGDQAFPAVEALIIGPNKEAIANVITKPNAIAYVSIGTAQEIAAKGGRLKLLDLDGVKASIENVANETYPLRRPLHVITNGPPQGTVKEFIDFLLGPEGQQIVRSHEFITVN